MISINWGTSVINIPKADLTLIQATPTEIRELNLNDFRSILKDLEDGADGIPFLKTHNHNTSIIIGGVTLAHVINLLPPYTVTFEDGQYAVNLVGANSNVGDRVNVNQVSVRSANSAGLVTSAGIEAIEYRGGVTVDVVNGVSGTLYPTGTLRRPVNNLVDARIIADSKGFKIVYIIGNITFGLGDNVDDMTIVGQHINQTTVVLESGCSTDGAQLSHSSVSGVLDGDAQIEFCSITTLQYVEGYINNSKLFVSIILAGSGTVQMTDCSDGQANGVIPTIDMGGTGRNITIARYSGDIKITNLSGNQFVSIDMLSGKVWLDSTVTGGYIFIRGNTTVDDQSNGATVDTDGVVNTEMLSDAVWDEPTINHNNADTFGKMIQDTETYIIRLLGLNQENYVMDTILYNGTLMTSAKLRLYSDNTLSTETDTYTINVTYIGNAVSTYTVVKD